MRDHQHVAAARGKRLLARFAEEAFQARLHLVEAPARPVSSWSASTSAT